MAKSERRQCPSVAPNWPDSQVFAVVAGTAERPEVAYLDKPQPVTPELLALAEPVQPTEVFRFTAPCARGGCQHFDSGADRCRLAQRVVRWMPRAVAKLPACAIRRDCVWWNQEGADACQRCPEMVSENRAPSEHFVKAATPETAPD